MAHQSVTTYGKCVGMICVDVDPSSFNSRAAELIKDGYGPFGGPYHCKAGVRQMFIKYDRDGAELPEVEK